MVICFRRLGIRMGSILVIGGMGMGFFGNRMGSLQGLGLVARYVRGCIFRKGGIDILAPFTTISDRAKDNSTTQMAIITKDNGVTIKEMDPEK